MVIKAPRGAVLFLDNNQGKQTMVKARIERESGEKQRVRVGNSGAVKGKKTATLKGLGLAFSVTCHLHFGADSEVR
jgi:hypothetical protein